MAPSKKLLPATPYRYVKRADHGERVATKGVVIHTIEGSATGAEGWFKNADAGGVAAHAIFGPSVNDGVVQIVPLDHKCWHAMNAGNAGYVGFEHEGSASYRKDLWLSAKYRRMLRQSANRTAYVCWAFRLGVPSKKNGTVVGHGDVPGNDHWDPGPGWPWVFYLMLCRRAYRKLQKSGKW